MKKYCSNCGAELNENATVCVNCGKIISENSTNLSTINKSKKKKKVYWPIPVSMFVGMIICQILYFTITFLLNDKISKDLFFEETFSFTFLSSIARIVSGISLILSLLLFPTIIVVIVLHFANKNK